MKDIKNIKNIKKSYLIIAILLLGWAAKDFYAYFNTGTALVDYYNGQGIIVRLVENTLSQGIIKLVLCALFVAIGLWRAKKGQCKGARAMITVNLAVHIFVLWFMGVATLTLGTTNYVFNQLSTTGLDLAKHAAMVGGLTYLWEDSKAMEQDQYNKRLVDCMNKTISGAGASITAASYSGYPSVAPLYGMVYDDEFVDCDTAFLFLNREGDPVRQSGDFIYFDYVTEEDWAAGIEDPTHSGWMDLGSEDDSRYALIRTQYSGTGDLYDWHALRLTGTMVNGRMEPLSMALASEGYYYTALSKAKPGWDIVDYQPITTVYSDGTTTVTQTQTVELTYPYTISELDNMGYLTWDVRFDNTDNADANAQLVTIYAIYPKVSICEPQGDVTYHKTENYENLLTLLKANIELENTYGNKAQTWQAPVSQFRMDEMIVFGSYNLFDPFELEQWENAGSIADDYPGAAYTLFTAMRARPLKITMGFLTRTYIISFLIAALSFVLTRRNIIKNLLEPLETVNDRIRNGWTNLDEYIDTPPEWDEANELVNNYSTTKSLLGSRKNEIARLGAALEYAKTAEQNRRRLTSNIAHELKTPLAVVHSYAEGLKEHIADDKRDKYLDIILGETGRMDTMVLEMLDLSRLEAGKIKLSRDEFSLKALAESVFEKLMPLLEAKSLMLELDFSDDCVVTADEGRIAQVLENFASNAVKYTDAGGAILVRGRNFRKETGFYIQNDSRPLTAEQLSKVWDSFYRTDEARGGNGTGLGLAIAKSIIELHGGSCAAHNTKNGVEFSFTLPKGS